MISYFSPNQLIKTPLSTLKSCVSNNDLNTKLAYYPKLQQVFVTSYQYFLNTTQIVNICTTPTVTKDGETNVI